MLKKFLIVIFSLLLFSIQAKSKDSYIVNIYKYNGVCKSLYWYKQDIYYKDSINYNLNENSKYSYTNTINLNDVEILYFNEIILNDGKSCNVYIQYEINR